MRGRKARMAVEERRIAGYVRVSHSEQVENGYSLEAQRNRLTAYAAGTERELNEFYCDEGYSAGTLRRPSLQRLIVDVKAGRIDTIMVSKLDRLSRSLIDLLELVRLCEKYEVALVSASESIDTSTPAGRMMLQLLGVFAEFERGRISERISDVLADKRHRGTVYSRNVPFGFRRIGSKIVADEEQQAELAVMKRMHQDGASLRQIAAYLNDKGIRTNNGGKQFYAQTVKQVLFSRANASASRSPGVR